MERLREYEPFGIKEIKFEPLNIFPPGTFEYFLVMLINKLDLTGFYKLEKDKGGETPYDPRAMLGIILNAYSHGIFYARQMDVECRNSFSYMFVSGHNTPHHSTLSRFLIKYADQIIELLTKIIYLANEDGYLDYNLIAIDGTKIRAKASDKFTGTFDDFVKRIERLKDKIKNAVEKQKIEVDENRKKYWNKKHKRYEDKNKKLESIVDKGIKKLDKNKKKLKQNMEEPDSNLQKFHGGGVGWGYNGQAAACERSGIIIAADLINNSNDRNCLFSMLDAIKDAAPQKVKKLLTKSKYVADNGYFSAKNIVEALQKDIDVYIADGTSKQIYSEAQDMKKEIKKSVSIKDCHINKTEAGFTITCPGERTFTDLKPGKNKERERYRLYVTEKEKCEGCKYFGICIGKCKKKKKVFEIAAIYLDYYDVLKSHKEKLYSEDGKMIYSRRMPIIERVFAYIKGKLGLRKFSRKGLKKAKTEWILGCIIHNLKRMFNLQDVKT